MTRLRSRLLCPVGQRNIRFSGLLSALLLFFSHRKALHVKAQTSATDEFASMFASESEFPVMGPTQFPKPTKIVGDEAVVLLTPTFGKHRPDQDAVFAYAEGYDLPHYMLFVNSLRATGFTGDIVFAVSALGFMEPDVEDFLRAQPNLIAYAMNFTCSSDQFVTTTSRKQDNGGWMSFQMCKLDNIYGYPDLNGEIQPLPDPRSGRVVATSRYELYWIWALQYHSHAWLMLLDARDAYFQTNPFEDLPRSSSDSSAGMLFFFGENVNSTSLGKSPKNRKWLERGYSMLVRQLLADKPTICSGSTMGEQIALETYLRAMVNEWDETHVVMKGADQGFHNYLYYTHKLANTDTIRSITVFEQGKGLINNLGALRVKPLTEWGVLNNITEEVFNWDGSLSPVVHQWDRDSDLFRIIEGKRFRQLYSEWNVKTLK